MVRQPKVNLGKPKVNKNKISKKIQKIQKKIKNNFENFQSPWPKSPPPDFEKV